jgi:hypothetical protein
MTSTPNSFYPQHDLPMLPEHLSCLVCDGEDIPDLNANIARVRLVANALRRPLPHETGFYQLVDQRRRLCQSDLHTPIVLRVRRHCCRGQGLPTSNSVALRSRYRCSTCSYRMSMAILGGLAPDSENEDAQDAWVLSVHQHAYCRFEADHLGPRQRRQDDNRTSTSTSPGLTSTHPIRRIRSLATFESRSIIVNGSLGRKYISLYVLE